jgi:hypothetical protein
MDNMTRRAFGAAGFARLLATSASKEPARGQSRAGLPGECLGDIAPRLASIPS